MRVMINLVPVTVKWRFKKEQQSLGSRKKLIETVNTASTNIRNKMVLPL